MPGGRRRTARARSRSQARSRCFGACAATGTRRRRFLSSFLLAFLGQLEEDVLERGALLAELGYCDPRLDESAVNRRRRSGLGRDEEAAVVDCDPLDRGEGGENSLRERAPLGPPAQVRPPP